jgi:hypothetical protein
MNALNARKSTFQEKKVVDERSQHLKTHYSQEKGR